MKNLRKIGVVLLAVAMLCSMSVVAFADDVNAVVENSNNNSQIQINSAKVVPGSGILTITLDYSITGGVQEGDQITMLGYLFDGDATTGDATTVVEGKIRAIDQAAAVETNGKIKFTLATTGDYAVAADAIMAVKLGSDAANVTKAQAFLIDLTKTEAQIGTPGDVTGDDLVTSDDVDAVQLYYLDSTRFPFEYDGALNNADVVGKDGQVTSDDVDAIQLYYLDSSRFPFED